MTNSKEKGKRYEREIASQLRGYGYDARRSQQYAGINNDADVVGLPYIHIEAKHRERGHGEIYDWMAQAISDAKEGEIPTVWHRKNHCETLVTMRMSDFMEMYRDYEVGRVL